MLPNIIEQELFEIGFIKATKSCWIGWKDYILHNINPKYGHYLKATIHIPVCTEWGGEMLTKILIHRYYDDTKPSKLEEYLNEKDSEQVYLGQINSKEHLVQLLKDLFITE